MQSCSVNHRVLFHVASEVKTKVPASIAMVIDSALGAPLMTAQMKVTCPPPFGLEGFSSVRDELIGFVKCGN